MSHAPPPVRARHALPLPVAGAARHWKMIAACAVIGGVAAFLAASLVRPRYRAQATIYTLSYQGNALSGALLARNFGGGASALAAQGTINDTASYLVSILRSHAVADAVCRRLDLAHRDDFTAGRAAGPWSLAEALRGCVIARGDFAGLITVSAVAPTPDLASDIANTYVAALDDFMSTTARGKRRFIERQLSAARAELAALERDLKDYQASHGSYALDVEAAELIRNWGQLRADAAATQVALQENAGVVRVSGSIDDLVALRSRRAGLEARSGELRQLVGDLERRLAALPEVGLGAARLRRKMEAKQALTQTLEAQLELARIAEVEEQARYQVLDRAYPPLRPAWPRRKLSAVVGAAAGMMLGLLGSYLLGTRREVMDANA